jgi:hypothetical protein
MRAVREQKRKESADSQAARRYGAQGAKFLRAFCFFSSNSSAVVVSKRLFRSGSRRYMIFVARAAQLLPQRNIWVHIFRERERERRIYSVLAS